jgi:hypothetical protein
MNKKVGTIIKERDRNNRDWIIARVGPAAAGAAVFI